MFFLCRFNENINNGVWFVQLCSYLGSFPDSKPLSIEKVSDFSQKVHVSCDRLASSSRNQTRISILAYIFEILVPLFILNYLSNLHLHFCMIYCFYEFNRFCIIFCCSFHSGEINKKCSEFVDISSDTLGLIWFMWKFQIF